MNVFHTISLRLTAVRELGFTQTGLFFLYQLGKRAALWRILTPKREWGAYSGKLKTEGIPPAPDWEGTLATNRDHAPNTLASAEEMINGRVTLFGALTVPLTLTVPGPLRHWTHYEASQFNGQDIKFTWEPARFGWVFPLARAYQLTGDEKYPAAFWESFAQFYAANPPNQGPHWASAQEVGLRLIALVFAHRTFASSPHATPERITALGRAVAAHAARIPPTLLYARAQNNNHLLSEAAALYTAGLTLPDHPHAAHWRTLGWKWFHHGLQTQIEPDGTYAQHSTNYHRLMLQLAMWVHAIAQHDPFVVGTSVPGAEAPATNPFPALSLERLAAATHWLLALCDPETGRVPNLGPNDGAYLLPHPTLPFHDYRPVLQAASRAFLRHSDLQSPPTDLCLLTTVHSRAYLRTARFRTRPGHADQLHLDLWWRGLNIALDPGTYLYNADPPWDNPLTSAFVHNTLTVNGLDQMTRTGRFLYVHRAQATLLERAPTRLIAEHDGYRKLGLTHRRTVETTDLGWKVIDQLLQVPGYRLTSDARASNFQPSTFTYRLHWLLPDWPWKLEGSALAVQSPHGEIRVKMVHNQWPIADVQLFRAGEMLVGEGAAHPTWGWYSPTYGVKEPALAFVGVGAGKVNGRVITEWEFPREISEV